MKVCLHQSQESIFPAQKRIFNANGRVHSVFVMDFLTLRENSIYFELVPLVFPKDVVCGLFLIFAKGMTGRQKERYCTSLCGETNIKD